ncbi:hypothetical protein GEMRC1_002952 [Eukaryota sp. GEM-RC1]
MSNLSVRRIIKEAKDLAQNPPDGVIAGPIEDDLFVWHFTLTGPEDTDFEGGIYHGKIIIPSTYPMKPPDIIFENASGRFQPGVRICLNITGYHEDIWRPSWSLSSVLVGLRSVFPDNGNGAIGSIDSSPQIRRALAKSSREHYCHVCKTHMYTLFPADSATEAEESPDSPQEEVTSSPYPNTEVLPTQSPSRSRTYLVVSTIVLLVCLFYKNFSGHSLNRSIL